MTRRVRFSLIAGLAFFVLGILTAGAGQQGRLRNGQYTSPNSIFSVRLPRPSNWAGVPWVITPLNIRGERQYDRVMFSVKDFGEYLVAGARLAPPGEVAAMDKDDHRTVLRNVSEATLIGWRNDLDKDPMVSREGYFESPYGEAIVRIYRAEKGSFLTVAQGRRPTADDRIDTNIASVVARQSRVVVYVLAQNDSKADDADALVDTAIAFFQEIRVSANR